MWLRCCGRGSCLANPRLLHSTSFLYSVHLALTSCPFLPYQQRFTPILLFKKPYIKMSDFHKCRFFLTSGNSTQSMARILVMDFINLFLIIRLISPIQKGTTEHPLPYHIFALVKQHYWSVVSSATYVCLLSLPYCILHQTIEREHSTG